MWTPRKNSKTCLFIQGTRSVCRYVLAERGTPTARVTAVGSFEPDDSQSLAEQLRAQMASRDLRFRRVVVLLPRAELDVVALHLPPATDAELPQLVSHAAAQEVDDSAGARVHDFLVTHQDDETCEVLAFSADQTAIDQLRSSFKAVGWNLIGVTFAGVGGVELLKQLARRSASTAVVVATGDQDIDLVVQASGRPLLFRTMPQSLEDAPVLAERLTEEIRRSLALAHRADDDSTRLYLIGDVSEHEQLAQSLSDRLSCSVSVVSPLDQVLSDVEVQPPSRYANLLGMACAWNRGALGLDLLNPRRPPARPGPYQRVAFWGSIAAAVLLAVGYVVVHDRAAQVDAIRQKQEALQQLVRRANKAHHLQDIVDAVRNWRRDDIVWLDELRTLSEQLPAHDEALVRTLNMATDPQGRGVIDLAVQVSKPEVVAGLEDALRDGLRSVSSKRITESDEQGKLPWAFETRVVFQPETIPELRIADQSAPANSAAQTAAEPANPMPIATQPVKKGSLE